MAEPAFGKGGERAANLDEDRAERLQIVWQQSEVGKRAAAQVLGYFISALMPAAGLEDLGDVFPIQ